MVRNNEEAAVLKKMVEDLTMQGTNPDPWTKRRLHNGAMIESGNGAQHRNFEMLTTAPGSQMRHWWRDNSTVGFPWHSGIVQGNDVAVCPTLTSTTFNRNFESVHLTTNHRLHHWYFDQAGGHWHDGGVFGPNDAAGVPGFLQGNYGAPGNFEVVVRTGDSKLIHCWRDGGGWHDGVRFGSNVACSGASLVQSHYGTQGNLELVCALSSGQMQHFWRDNDHAMVWKAGATFGSGISSPPCMIEGAPAITITLPIQKPGAPYTLLRMRSAHLGMRVMRRRASFISAPVVFIHS